jgi:hypothetical protein
MRNLRSGVKKPKYGELTFCGLNDPSGSITLTVAEPASKVSRMILRPRLMLIWRTLGVRSTVGSGVVVEASVPTPSRPYFSSPIVKGKPKVAPEVKSNETAI